MTREMGITVGDLRKKLEGIPDDTEVYISHNEWESNYTVDTISLVGMTSRYMDDDDRVDGCPVGLELISNDLLEQGDLCRAFEGLAGYEQEDIIFYLLKEHDEILRLVLETYGRL